MPDPRPPRMMLAFVVRRCAVDLGREPSAAEFASWANGSRTDNAPCLFGRPISEDEARLILSQRSRVVTARSAAPEEQWIDADDLLAAKPSANVVSILQARRHRAASRRRVNGKGPGSR